ncbi:tRNA synthetases class I-domain-containing protein [Mucidula mucida]|nr:tRNA synthetases class I-domain-containing protein [Mucidula mucida]
MQLAPTCRGGIRLCASWSRSQSTSATLSKTLFLPKTHFPLWPDRQKSEIGLRPKVCEELYRIQAQRDSEPFVLHDGPPYANGSLHMGHAMNKIVKDIICRFNVICGKRVNYTPGWDCHGLPIENKALKDLGVDSTALSPTALRSAARETALREIVVQKQEFQQFGVMADWHDDAATYRTLDHDYEMRQLEIFKSMVEKGLIYRKYRPVHYSPSSHSALAEAELVYKEDHVSHSVYVTFDVDLKSNPELQQFGVSMQLLVWTTTPWTLTANMGIAVNDDLTYLIVKRLEHGGPLLVIAKSRLEALADILGPVDVVSEVDGHKLVGTRYVPMFTQKDETFEVIHAPHVTSESGTGLVHCAPAHGAEDYNAFRSLSLDSMLCHVDHLGQFSDDVRAVVGETDAASLIGQSVLEGGSRAVVELLKAKGALVKIKRIKHKYPYDWRTNEPIIVTYDSHSRSPFDYILTIRLALLRNARNRLESFVRSRSEWCISRQRVWGVPIPALHHVSADRTILDTESLTRIIAVLREKGLEHWWDGPVEDFLPPHLLHEKYSWRKGTDTMDVWFDSGSSWSLLPPRANNYRADVCVEGSDQHRGWFQSQLLTSVGVGEPSAPYGCLLTHGMVLDEAGKKMSKSLGNVISPVTVVVGGENKKKDPAYGADVLRLWVASVEYTRDVSVGPKVLAQTAESFRKLRNSARFLLGTVGEFSSIEADKYILHQTAALEKLAYEDYQAFNFPRVVNSLVLKTMIKVAAPILPHLTQEIYQTMYPTSESSVFLDFPWSSPDMRVAEMVADSAVHFDELLRIRSGVLALLEKARRNKEIKSSLEAEVDVIIPSFVNGDVQGLSALMDTLTTQQEFLQKLFIVSNVSVTDEGSFGTESPAWLYSGSVDIDIKDCDESVGLRVRPSERMKCPRCWTYTREEAHDVCERCEDTLGGRM